MSKKFTLAASVIVALAALTAAGHADDPAGSTSSAPQRPAPDVPAPSVIPLPDRGPTGLALRFDPIPPDLGGAGDQGAAVDQQIDVLLGVTPPEPTGPAFAVASDGDGTAASSANCWDNGVGCGPGGQAQFEANCHSQGGGLSSHDGGDQGTYVKCTLPPN